MIKEAIEKIVDLAKPELITFGKKTIAVYAGGGAEEINPSVDMVSVIGLNSLDALIKLVKTEAVVRWATPLYVTVPNHFTVRCFGQPYGIDERFVRPTYYEATASDVPGWQEKVQLGFEEAIIALQTRFEETPDTTYAMKLLSEITSGSKVTYNDNGIAQTVVTAKGIAMQGMDRIKPIIELRPYRTFQEVAQPVSKFLIRINERGITFTEADGGMWKLAARATVMNYLETAFANEITSGKVVVTM